MKNGFLKKSNDVEHFIWSKLAASYIFLGVDADNWLENMDIFSKMPIHPNFLNEKAG